MDTRGRWARLKKWGTGSRKKVHSYTGAWSLVDHLNNILISRVSPLGGSAGLSHRWRFFPDQNELLSVEQLQPTSRCLRMRRRRRRKRTITTRRRRTITTRRRRTRINCFQWSNCNLSLHCTANFQRLLFSNTLEKVSSGNPLQLYLKVDGNANACRLPTKLPNNSKCIEVKYTRRSVNYAAQVLLSGCCAPICRGVYLS